MPEYQNNYAEQDKDEKQNRIRKAALEGANFEAVQRYGNAAKQHYVAYSGVDNEAGKQLSKGLKSISNSRVNHNYQSQNIKQQAGFSAEVKSVARKNAQNIIDGQPNKFIRTDDLGSVNDPLYDLIELDSDGQLISGTGSQMKFVGQTPEDLLAKLSSKKFQKYLDNDAILDIADDDYDLLMGFNGNSGIIDEKISLLQRQLTTAEQLGNNEISAQKQAQIAKLQKIKKNLRKSGLTRKEAIIARRFPKLSTAKDIVNIAGRAGQEQAKNGAKISGAITLVKNVIACLKDEKTPEEAAGSVIIDTGTGAATSYISAFSGTVIKGAMQNSSFDYARSLSKSNFPAVLATTTIDIGKTIHKYFAGTISGPECVEELGNHGIGEIGSAMFSVIGAGIVPSSAPLVASIAGGLIGATLGYAAATACYNELHAALKEAETARVERIRIEKECEEAIALICQYRKEMEVLAEKYLARHILIFNKGFAAMDKAIIENDINGFIRANSDIQRLLGKEVQFHTQEEFDLLMSSNTAFRL